MSTKLRRRRKTRKLTRDQKKAIWAEPAANAGAGWEPKWPKPEQDPVKFLREDES